MWKYMSMKSRQKSCDRRTVNRTCLISNVSFLFQTYFHNNSWFNISKKSTEDFSLHTITNINFTLYLIYAIHVLFWCFLCLQRSTMELCSYFSIPNAWLIGCYHQSQTFCLLTATVLTDVKRQLFLALIFISLIDSNKVKH